MQILFTRENALSACIYELEGRKKRRGGSERGEKNARGVRIEDLEERGVVVSTTCSDCNHNRCVPLR
jgi:hypothetical protein